jgi:hypothetical protein
MLKAAAPPSVGRKFNSDGVVIPFRGNTILCHLPKAGGGAAFISELIDIQRRFADFQFGRKVSYTPPSSYHVTIFAGAADQKRKPGYWPTELPLSTPIDECNDFVAERLRTFSLDCELPLRMKVDVSDAAADRLPLSFGLLPLDESENDKLRKLRDRLAECLGIRPRNQATYRFHITLGYAIEWLTVDEEAVFLDAHRRWRATLARHVVELGAPEYCTHEDMLAFDRQVLLA